MANELKHNPTPWRFYNPFNDDPRRVVDANGRFIFGDSCGPSRDDAAYIVECVNSHERLVEENARLRELVRRMIRPTETALSFAIKEGEIVKRICGTEEAEKEVEACIAALQDLLAEARAALG